MVRAMSYKYFEMNLFSVRVEASCDSIDFNISCNFSDD